MELPADVLIHNQLLGVKGAKGSLLAIHPVGSYEINMKFGERVHRVLLPIGATVVISQEAEETDVESLEIER